MQRILALSIFIGLVCALPLRAEEGGVPGRTAGGKAPAKGDKEGNEAGARSKDKVEPVNNAVGTLSEKPADSKVEHLVAVLKMAERDRALNLTATGGVAEKLAELAKKGAKVRVTGDGSDDGSAMNVKHVNEVADAADKAEKKKKKKNDDK